VHLDFWFDFISPYAFFAWLRIRDVAADAGATLRLRPVVLAGLLDHHGQLGPAEIPAKREHTFKDVARYAAVHGIPLRGPATHPFNPLTALRCSLPEVAGERQADVIDALFRAGWSDGIDLGDPAAIARALSAVGLDGEALVARTRDPAVKQALIDEGHAAIARGVFGVPTMDTDGELIWGNDRMDWVALRLKGRDPLPPDAQVLLDRPVGARRPSGPRR
jgi:2-hydroxychromene-2-carboxylate isomerase